MEVAVSRRKERQYRVWGNNDGLCSDCFFLDEAGGGGQVRLADATIVSPTSDFTRYPGRFRHHVLVEGEASYWPEGVFLNPEGSEWAWQFNGSKPLWCTTSTPDVSAINIIHSGKLDVLDELYKVPDNKSVEVVINYLNGDATENVQFMYCVKGTVKILIKNKSTTYVLNEGDAILIRLKDHLEGYFVELQSAGKGEGRLYRAALLQNTVC